MERRRWRQAGQKQIRVSFQLFFRRKDRDRNRFLVAFDMHFSNERTSFFSFIYAFLATNARNHGLFFFSFLFFLSRFHSTLIGIWLNFSFTFWGTRFWNERVKEIKKSSTASEKDSSLKQQNGMLSQKFQIHYIRTYIWRYWRLNLFFFVFHLVYEKVIIGIKEHVTHYISSKQDGIKRVPSEIFFIKYAYL